MISLFRVFMSDAAIESSASVLRSGYIGQGERVAAFEAELARELGTGIAPLTTNSCTSALDLAFELCSVGQGSEVVSTPMTCIATNSQLVARGAKIVWADVDPFTGLIDPRAVGECVTDQTRAIVTVDWGGVLCDYRALRRELSGRGLTIPIVQDAAHSFGSVVAGEPFCRSGNRGDFVCWSFQAIKHLTTGDGGAILVPGPRRKEAELLRWYGLDRSDSTSFRCSQMPARIGFKYHMNDIAASIGLANLPSATRNVGTTRRNAAFYSEQFREYADKSSGRILHAPNESLGSSWWLYTLLVSDREEFQCFLRENGVESSPVHAPNHKMPGFRQAIDSDLPGVDFFSEHQVSIPVGWWLSQKDREHVAETVKRWALKAK